MNPDKTIKLTPQTLQILNALPLAATVTDTEGNILFYNDCASQNLDRKPEYIGRDIRFCHKKAESVAKIDLWLAEFKAGREEFFSYSKVREGRPIVVTVAPLKDNGRLWGFLHTVMFP